MSANNWRKIENEEGYPCYIDDATGKEQYDHPDFKKIMESLKVYDGINHMIYRVAFKLYALQKHLKVPPLRIINGVFARHQLSLPETSLSLDTAEIEAVLSDIYFAAEKEGICTGDIEVSVDLLVNLLLNVYDKHRTEPIRALAAKTLLIILCEDSTSDKWVALASCCADHNNCVSPKRLATLLSYMCTLSSYLGVTCEQVLADVNTCFDKNSGMLGLSASAVSEWGESSKSASWLPVIQRVLESRTTADVTASCTLCKQPLIQVLKFKCVKCSDTYFCEKCYLYDKDMSAIVGHKKSHIVQEIIDGQVSTQVKSSQPLNFIQSMKKLFFCTKIKKRGKRSSRKNSEFNEGQRAASSQGRSSSAKRKGSAPVIFTSTVGKASGHTVTAHNPVNMLQDIINQLETQNKYMQDLMNELQNMYNKDGTVTKERAKTMAIEISEQINRLKMLREDLTVKQEMKPGTTSKSLTKPVKVERPQAFDLFSPIPVVEKEKESKAESVHKKNQPRVLSLDSGNFSVGSKHDSQNLMTLSGDALKPVVVHTSDSISTVSMTDISCWFNESDCVERQKSTPIHKSPEMYRTSAEQKFAADIRSVENSNDKMRELNADLDTVLDKLQQILSNNFAMDDSCFDNNQLRETANEMEGLLGTLIRGVEERATLSACKGLL